MSNRSDVARLRAEIADCNDSAWHALYGTAQGTAQHQFITGRLERMNELYDELKAVDERATEYLINIMNRK